MKPIDLSIILTLYNEGPTLSGSLARLSRILDESGLTFEMIFVDDKSKDNSLFQARSFIEGRNNCQIIEHQENIGRGGSVSEGIKKAKGRVAGFIDTDLEISPEKIPEATQTILKGEADIVTGYRVYKFRLVSFFRHILTKGYHLLVRLILGLPLKDTETGFKFFHREKILPILNITQDRRWFWDTEIMALSFRANLKIKEIPVIFKRRLDKKSTVNTFKDTIDYFIKLISFKLRKKQS